MSAPPWATLGAGEAPALAGRVPIDHVAIMANPSSADRSFIEQRRAGRYVGLYVLPTALVGVVGCWIALFAWWPLAVNPWFAVGAFEGQVVEPGTVTKYAMSAAVLVNLLLLSITSALALAIGWARSERRYLRLLTSVAEPPKSAEPLPPKVAEAEPEARR
jgi:hypothetical protein